MPWSFDYVSVPRHSPQQSRIQASESLLLPVLALCSLSGTDSCFCWFPRASSTAESIPLIIVWLSIQLPAGCTRPQSQLCFSDVQAHHTARRKSETVRANLGSVCSRVSVREIQKKKVLVWEYTTHTHTMTKKRTAEGEIRALGSFCNETPRAVTLVFSSGSVSLDPVLFMRVSSIWELVPHSSFDSHFGPSHLRFKT